MSFPVTPTSAFVTRRRSLGDRFKSPALFVAGAPPPRNYPANTYDFRPNSHYLYFGGPREPGAALLLRSGKTTLFAEPPNRDDALWHGPRPSLEEQGRAWAADEVRPLAELADEICPIRGEIAALAPQDAASVLGLSSLLGRTVGPDSSARDAELAEVVIGLRLIHDEAAVAQLQAAAAISSDAHVAGMRAARGAKSEEEICAAITHELYRNGMDDAYPPIVSVRGEVLHNHHHDGALSPGDLILCDVGGESPEGWASDITRTWPVNGQFSPTQRAIYEIVLQAQLTAIDKVRPGVRYRDVHDAAKRVIVTELVSLGILRGSVDGLLERGAAALFFPHGVGHLIGLDVHDMEDMGDRAGYAPRRERSPRFGDKYLRLDRDLAPGMAVTIEPGFYQVPEIMNDPELTAPLGADLARDVLERYRDVRGIRIEDDVLCTALEPVVLSARCPKNARDVETAIGG